MKCILRTSCEIWQMSPWQRYVRAIVYVSDFFTALPTNAQFTLNTLEMHP